MLDAPQTMATLPDNMFRENMMKFAWCTGYITAFQGLAIELQVHIALGAKLGVRITGPDKARQFVFDSIRVAKDTRPRSRCRIGSCAR